jgi:hypothetical protein
LSDCVNCPSAKTLEGKAHIQELSGKFCMDQQGIKQIETTDAAANNSTASAQQQLLPATAIPVPVQRPQRRIRHRAIW